MGKELQMAREEEERQSMLLARTGDGEAITTSYRGNKRKKKAPPSRRGYERKVEAAKAKSKDSGKVEGADASPSRPARRRRSNKDREQGRGDEGEDGRFRRSAQELGVTFPDSYCDDAELIPHYWKEVDRLHGGSLLQCKLCHRHLWLPVVVSDAVRLRYYIDKFGRTEGYCK